MSEPPARPPFPPAFDIVAIGASLGGVDAFHHILSALPTEFPAPIVLVQHLAPRMDSYLCDILSRHTRLPVRRAVEEMPLHRGTVHVAAPDCHLIVTPEHTLSLLDGPKVQFARPALDPLFHSVAAVYGERAIGVVLTGMNSDGAAGLCAIRQGGGITIAQDRATSQAFRMPRAAIDTGCVNFVLPIDKIASALIALAMMPGAAAFFSLPPSACYPMSA